MYIYTNGINLEERKMRYEREKGEMELGTLLMP